MSQTKFNKQKNKIIKNTKGSKHMIKPCTYHKAAKIVN